MKQYIITTLVLLFSLNIMAKNTVNEKPFYGKKINAKKAISLEKILKDYPDYENKNLVMEAVVDKVCTSKGCWMTLKGTKSAFRVKFEDYNFFVPLSLIGKKIWVDGEIKRKELSVKDARHYLEDSGASKDKIAAITKPSFEYHFTAKGVKVVP
jgi:hypothetical protein